MSIVKKAVVLAAGYGTRLKPFTCTMPKPLLPVWGVPMLERVLDMLRQRGVDDIAVNTHHLHAEIERWLDSFVRRPENASLGIRISHEPEILGSGGALRPLRDWIGAEPFYLVNSDIVAENVPQLAFSGEKEEIGVCALADNGPRTLEVEKISGYITNYRSEDAGMEGTLTYSGIALLKPEILSYVPEKGFSSVVSAYERAMQDGLFMRGAVSGEFLWEDAGTVGSYIDLNRDGQDNSFADIPQLKAVLGDAGGEIEFMGARGSERVFFRAGNKVVIVYDDGNREENGRYCRCAEFLRSKGLRVPAVLADVPSCKTSMVEYAGRERTMSFEDYVEAVKELVKFNGLGDSPDLPELSEPFGPETWEWERNLFRKYSLARRYSMEMPSAVRKELESVADRLELEPKALVHRDYQSTNLLWGRDGLSIIDFQGMRLGPAVYDLASLLYDPYVRMSDKRREALSALYAAESSRPGIVEALPYAAVQRLVQCLGAFGRLEDVGQKQFTKHIPAALEHLLAAADAAGLDATGALAEDLIAIEKRIRS